MVKSKWEARQLEGVTLKGVTLTTARFRITELEIDGERFTYFVIPRKDESARIACLIQAQGHTSGEVVDVDPEDIPTDWQGVARVALRARMAARANWRSWYESEGEA